MLKKILPIVPDKLLQTARRSKRVVFSLLHRKLARGRKIAFGERNNYGINPLFTTIDIENADICMNFNDCPVLPFADSTADVVFSSHALEHLTEALVEKFLHEAIRILRPGGILLAELPDCKFLYEKWRNGETDLFNEFLDDKEMCERMGYPQIYGRKDIAFAGIVSCINKRLDNGVYKHVPVIFEARTFEEQIVRLSMDECFDWLVSLQTDEEKLSGGHVSAWYPSKFNTALARASFRLIGDISLLRSLKIDPFLFRNGPLRAKISFRTVAIK